MQLFCLNKTTRVIKKEKGPKNKNKKQNKTKQKEKEKLMNDKR